VSAEEFLADAGRYDCVVLDVQLPGLSGLDLEEQIRTREGLAVVFFTGCADMKRAVIARNTGRLCLRKPADSRVLLEAVAHSIQARKFRS
jgi:FixJ family two-component response regulator